MQFLLIIKSFDLTPLFIKPEIAAEVEKLIVNYFQQDSRKGHLEVMKVVVDSDNVGIDFQMGKKFSEGMTIPKIINNLKSVTARHLANAFPELKGADDDSGIWSPGYLIITKGNLVEKKIDEYLDQLISLNEIEKLMGLGIDTGWGKKKANQNDKKIPMRWKDSAKHT